MLADSIGDDLQFIGIKDLLTHGAVEVALYLAGMRELMGRADRPTIGSNWYAFVASKYDGMRAHRLQLQIETLAALGFGDDDGRFKITDEAQTKINSLIGNARHMVRANVRSV